MTDTITVKLNDPLHANNQTYSELTFRKPTVGDLEDAQEEGGTNTIKISRSILALCAGIPPVDFRKISIDDWAKTDASQWIDDDDDDWGDNPNGTDGDACPGVWGNSTRGGVLGCLDSDGDGWADIVDAFINESSQWADWDGDGYGDN
ncbi:MAG: hypothetical protein CFH43_00911, partial [Proteobacteria bacterium]